jgi:hypothetical protein
MSTPGTPPSQRIFVTGGTGSGKSKLLRDLWLPRVPRALILDHTGEWEQLKGAQIAESFPALLRELRRAAARPRWRVVAHLTQDDRERLADLLVPAVVKRGSYALEVGGMALVDDEVSQTADGSSPPKVRGLWERGRHAGLTILAATQRPAQVARIVTSQSQWLGVCRLHEPNDVKYLRDALSPEAIAALEQLPEYGAILWDNRVRTGYVIDKHRRVVRRLNANQVSAV